MKNFLKRLSAFLLAMVLVLSIAACGGKSSGIREESQSASESVAPETQAPETAAPETDAVETAPEAAVESAAQEDESTSLSLFDSVDAFIASDAMQEQIDSLNESLASSGLSVDIQGEGNTLYYIYTVLDETTAASLDNASLESYVQSLESTLEPVADSVISVVSVDTVNIVVQFLAPDGTELISQEFTF